MFNKASKIGLVVVLLGAGLCLAQEKPRKERGKDRAQRPPNLRQVGLQDSDGLLTNMKEELRLTDSQQTEAKRLLDDYKRDVEALRGASKPDPDMGKKYADIRKQLEEARAAKDQARQQQLLDEMKNDRAQREAQEEPIRAGIEQATKTLHDRLAVGLGEKQKQGFESLWQDALAGKKGRGNRINPNQLKAVVMKLPNLAEDQKKQVEELFKTHDKAASETKNPVDRQKVAKTLYESVLALLNAEQKDKVKAEMGAGRDRGRDRATKGESKGG